MRLKLFYLILLIVISACTNRLTKEQSIQLLRLYKEQNYFKLDDLMSKIKFNKNNPDLLLYKATLDNVFNDPSESTELVSLILKQFPKYFNDTIVSELYLMVAINSFRLQDYESAYKADSFVVSKYKHVLDSSDIVDLKNHATRAHSQCGVKVGDEFSIICNRCPL